MQVKVQIDIDAGRIAHYLEMAICNGSTYWCEFLSEQAPAEPVVKTNDYTQEWAYYPLYAGGSFTLLEIDETSDEEGAGKKHTLDSDAVRRGLQAMAEHAPGHFSDLMRERGDIETADVLLQMCLFGELIYG